MLLIPLMALTVWTLWIDSDQAVKDFKVLKIVKILHRKRQLQVSSSNGDSVNAR
jgi:hypothetical protein